MNQRPKLGEKRTLEYTRTSLSITRELLEEIDKHPEARGNRSFFVENLLRKVLNIKELKR